MSFYFYAQYCVNWHFTRFYRDPLSSSPIRISIECCPDPWITSDPVWMLFIIRKELGISTLDGDPWLSVNAKPYLVVTTFKGCLHFIFSIFILGSYLVIFIVALSDVHHYAFKQVML